jgi:hypothetical protein
MPPQQGNCLLDVFDVALSFGAHVDLVTASIWRPEAQM